MTTEGITNTAQERSAPGKIIFSVLGFIYAATAYQVPVSIAAAVIAANGAANLMKASPLIQIAFGLLLSVIAYTCAWNRSFKLGMGAFYGAAVGLIAAIGAYTILSSF